MVYPNQSDVYEYKYDILLSMFPTKASKYVVIVPRWVGCGEECSSQTYPFDVRGNTRMSAVNEVIRADIK